MSEGGRLIRTDPEVLGVWKRLTALFATWRVVLASVSRRSLSQFSNDQMTPISRATHWKIGLGLLGGLDDVQVDFLKDYAALNANRVERVFRTTALLLVSVPVAGVFGISEVEPDFWGRIGFEQLDTLIVILGLWMVSAGIMMAAAWRARDLADLVEFEAARRRFYRAKRTGA
ncbi:MAG: hypothetical protein U9P68_06190 [Pseudomonadota bacterium]|nr:hypothetical protein [Pseudomonadota bacterium]